MKTDFKCNSTNCNNSIDSQARKDPDFKTYCQTDNGKWVSIVKKFISNLNYGQVILTVHDSKVVQIEKTEKVRL